MRTGRRARGPRGPLLVLFALLALAVLGPVRAEQGGAGQREEAGGDEILVRIGSDRITVGAFEAQFASGIRQRFYHGKVPAERLKAYREELLQSMIDRRLLVAEARRRGIRPDPARIDGAVARISRRYEKSRLWRQRGESLKVSLREGLKADDLIDQLHARLDALVGEPSDQDLRAYYEGHPEQFTTPERSRVAVILLKVDPWAPESAWQAALDEARSIRDRIEHGASFAEQARLHSADASADKGGDLGYIHRGMLSPEAEKVVDGLDLGQVSQPLRLLKGIALFRLADREPARLNPFESARERVRSLYLREERRRRWQGLIDRLRASTVIDVDRERLARIGSR